MDYKNLIYLIGFCISFSSVSASMCYQETANASNGADGSCGLKYSGKYLFDGFITEDNINNSIDGNWNTLGTCAAQGSGGNCYLYINYSKPSDVLNSSLWQIKNSDGISNESLDFNCLNNDTSNIILRLKFTWGPFARRYIISQCFEAGGTDSGWKNVNGGSTSNTQFYEEAMWWNISDAPINTTNQTRLVYDYKIKSYDSININRLVFLHQSNNFTTNTNNALCYQESANVTNIADGSCGLNYTGSYVSFGSWLTDVNSSYDGNWTTYALVPDTATWGSVDVNYTIPLSITNTSIWRTKVSSTTSNRTIPSDCLSNKILQLRMNISTNTEDAKGYCYNSTTWKLLFTTGCIGTYYEEAMWWNISQTTTRPVHKNIFNLLINNIKVLVR